MRQNELVIHVRLPNWTKTHFAALAVGLLLLGGVAYAGLNVWNDGDKLSAADLNANFDQLKTDLDKIQTRVVESDANFCGYTPQNYTGNIGGYAAANAKCQAACGSPTAHICTTQELFRAVSANKLTANPFTYVRYATMVITSTSGTDTLRDCNGFQGTAESAAVWSVTNSLVSVSPCTTSLPLACCN